MPRKLDYDVCVVGAGPVGSITSKFAALKGAKVLMLEKRQEIGSPVRCGEGVSKYWLESVGIKPDRRWIANEVDGARIFSPAGRPFIVNERQAGNEVGFSIERDIFDKSLAKDAAKAGTDIMLKTSALDVIRDGSRIAGVRAKCMGEDIEIRSKVLVGADGYESQVGRWAGIDTKLKPSDIDTCLQYRMTGIDIDKRYADFYLGSCAPGGYVWVFPKGDDIANVGIGLQLSRIKERGEVKKYLDAFIEAHPGIKKGKRLDMVAGAVSICAPIERTVGDGILLVGDAARQIDPITGGGISNGCVAGKVAGEVIAEAIQAKDYSSEFLQRYEKGWRALLEDKLYRNWLAKEKMVTLSDDTLNKVIDTLIEVGVEKLNVFHLLKAIESKFPEVVKEFEEFL